jgi:hypothetical protein
MLSLTRILNSSRLLKALTGVTKQEFEILLAVFAQILIEAAISKPRQRAFGGGDKSILETPAHKLLYILFYIKVYPTYDVAGAFFGAVRSAAFAWTKKFLPLLEKTLGRTVEMPKRQIHSVEEFIEAFPDIKDIFVDGTERPTQRPKNYNSQRKKYSGKKKRHTRKNAIIVDEKKKILFLSPTKDGRVHDLKQLKKTGVHQKIPKGVTMWGDKGYQGLKKSVPPGVNVITPHKKPKKGELSQAQKEENKVISGIRIVVEHAIGGIKRYKAVADIYRNRRNQDDSFIMVSAGLWNLHLAQA